MPKRSSRDLNETAFSIVQQSTGQTAPKPDKNPAAVALGRLGGLKGGKARALKLSKKDRSRIAAKAAKARWDNKLYNEGIIFRIFYKLFDNTLCSVMIFSTMLTSIQAAEEFSDVIPVFKQAWEMAWGDLMDRFNERDGIILRALTLFKCKR